MAEQAALQIVAHHCFADAMIFCTHNSNHHQQRFDNNGGDAFDATPGDIFASRNLSPPLSMPLRPSLAQSGAALSFHNKDSDLASPNNALPFITFHRNPTLDFETFLDQFMQAPPTFLLTSDSGQGPRLILVRTSVRRSTVDVRDEPPQQRRPCSPSLAYLRGSARVVLVTPAVSSFSASTTTTLSAPTLAQTTTDPPPPRRLPSTPLRAASDSAEAIASDHRRLQAADDGVVVPRDVPCLAAAAARHGVSADCREALAQLHAVRHREAEPPVVAAAAFDPPRRIAVLVTTASLLLLLVVLVGLGFAGHQDDDEDLEGTDCYYCYCGSSNGNDSIHERGCPCDDCHDDHGAKYSALSDDPPPLSKRHTVLSVKDDDDESAAVYTGVPVLMVV